MNSVEILKHIKSELVKEKQVGRENISADVLIDYMDVLEKEVSSKPDIARLELDLDLAKYRASHERNLTHYQAVQNHALELLRSTISYGAAAIKSAILINGGAAVAMLAFIGNVWGKGISQAAVQTLTSSITCFTTGALVGSISTAGAYLAQYFYTEKHSKTAAMFHIFTALLIICSYILFGFGVNGAYLTFLNNLALTNQAS